MAQEQWRRRSGKFPSGDGMVVTLLYTSVSVWLAFEPTPVVQELPSSLVALFFLLLILFTSFFFFLLFGVVVFQYFGLWCFLLPLDDDEYLEAFGLTKNLISSNHSEIKVSFLFNIFPFLFCCSCQLLLSLIFSFVVVLLFLLPELKKRCRWRFVFSVVSSLSSTWAAVADAIGCRRACTCLFHIIF